jgi:enamine deaminase RidA (YjgF/YER057c/UK114 family)
LQAKRCLEIITKAIENAGGRLDQVVRTRVYLTDITKSEEVGRAHGEFFGDIRPASLMVEVSGFVRKEWLVEIEAECWVDPDEDA